MRDHEGRTSPQIFFGCECLVLGLPDFQVRLLGYLLKLPFKELIMKSAKSVGRIIGILK